MSPRSTRALLVAMIAAAGPTALGLDLLARRFVMAEQPEDLRQFMAEHVTRFAWFVVPGPLLGGILGFMLYPRMYRSALTKSRASGSKLPDLEHKADLTALLLCTTMAQVPALFGDLSVMLGANLTPALCSTSLSMTAVTLIGLLARPRDLVAPPS
jgi:hypothetical protein